MASRIRLQFFCICVCSLFHPLMVSAEEGAALQWIETDSGERLVGEVLPESNDLMLHFRSGLLGEIVLPRSRVVRMEVVPLDEEPRRAAVKTQPAKGATKPLPSPKSPSPPPQVKAKAVQKPVPVMASEVPEEVGLFDYLSGLRAPDSWSGNFRMGMNISTGDSLWTQTYLRGKLEIRQKGKPSLYRLTGSYVYQENERSNGQKIRSQDKYDASFLYRYKFKNEWFVQNTVALRADQKKGIDRDLSNLLGFGYSFRPFKKLEFNVGGAGGVADYQSNSGSNRNGGKTTLSVFEELVWKPLRRTSLIHRFNYFWNPEDNNQYNFVMKTALRVRMTDLLGFEFSYNKNYDNDTGAGNNKNDTRWLNALIFYF